MIAIHIRVVGVGLFFLFTFLSGFWLSRAGKPYNGIVLTIHKLISLAAVASLVVTIYQTNQTTMLSAIEWIASVVAGLFFLGTIITGGLLSTDKPMPAAIQRLHQITPYLTVLSTVTTLYLLLLG
jgi:hypothetical protein